MKKILPGLLAIVVAISLSAFTAQKHQPKKLSGEQWFHFDGTSPNDLTDPAMYSLDGDGSAPTVCSSITLQYRCEINAQPQSGNPDQPDLTTIVDQRKRSTP